MALASCGYLHVRSVLGSVAKILYIMRERVQYLGQ